MKKCKVLLTNNILFDNVKVMDSFIDRLSGLMFQKKPHDKVLLFKNAYWIHSFFCFVEFSAIFLDKDLQVLSHMENIKPGKILPPVFGAKYIIEYIDKPVKINIKDKLEIVYAKNCR